MQKTNHQKKYKKHAKKNAKKMRKKTRKKCEKNATQPEQQKQKTKKTKEKKGLTTEPPGGTSKNCSTPVSKAKFVPKQNFSFSKICP